ncbi:type II methionyl aminopeptidase [Candidatus Woesearchaeota archaeon]|nr:type II methionyl aminopeptidase [Candidatus Woesearchaeota archaeon]
MFEEEKFLLAGKITGQARDYGKSLIKEGALVVDILNDVENFILKKGAGIAFPAQISLNTVAAHACSDEQDETVVASDDVVKLDVGAHIDGHIGDTALTVNLSGEYKELLAASKAALTKASKLFTPGMRVGEIGRVIQDEITAKGFSPVRNLSGHGLGLYQIHTAPQIPNIYLNNSLELAEGMTVACEPFATNGKGAIAESGDATVFSFVGKKPVRSPFAREVLKRIESYNGLPFTTRWLSKEFGVGKTKLALKELGKVGIIHGHPPLKEIGNGMVSQHEHTFLVKDAPVITTKSDD